MKLVKKVVCPFIAHPQDDIARGSSSVLLLFKTRKMRPRKGEWFIQTHKVRQRKNSDDQLWRLKILPPEHSYRHEPWGSGTITRTLRAPRLKGSRNRAHFTPQPLHILKYVVECFLDPFQIWNKISEKIKPVLSLFLYLLISLSHPLIIFQPPCHVKPHLCKLDTYGENLTPTTELLSNTF